MPDLHIRNVDPDVIERLKAQAKRNHRSMEAEARDILSGGCRRRLPPEEWVEMMRRLREAEPLPVSDLTTEDIKRMIEAEDDDRFLRLYGPGGDETDDRR